MTMVLETRGRWKSLGATSDTRQDLLGGRRRNSFISCRTREDLGVPRYLTLLLVLDWCGPTHLAHPSCVLHRSCSPQQVVVI